MDYYTFEYLILMSVSGWLRIDSINISSDIYDAMRTVRNVYGELETKVVSRMMTNDSIRLNFDLDFHYEFKRRILKEAFTQGLTVETVARRLRTDIRDRFVKTFLERKVEP